MSDFSTNRTGRTRILEACSRVILREGILALTLDAVAKEAKLSKGGLLYHFASKEQLVRGLIEHFIARFERRMVELREVDPEPRGSWTRAYIQACHEKLDDPDQDLAPAELRQVFMSLLATLVLTPELISVVKNVNARWEAEIANDGLEPAEQMLALAASEGLLFWEMIHVMESGDPRRAFLVEALKQRAAALPHADAAESHALSE